MNACRFWIGSSISLASAADPLVAESRFECVFQTKLDSIYEYVFVLNAKSERFQKRRTKASQVAHAIFWWWVSSIERLVLRRLNLDSGPHHGENSLGFARLNYSIAFFVFVRLKIGCILWSFFVVTSTFIRFAGFFRNWFWTRFNWHAWSPHDWKLSDTVDKNYFTWAYHQQVISTRFMMSYHEYIMWSLCFKCQEFGWHAQSCRSCYLAVGIFWSPLQFYGKPSPESGRSESNF